MRAPSQPPGEGGALQPGSAPPPPPGPPAPGASGEPLDLSLERRLAQELASSGGSNGAGAAGAGPGSDAAAAAAEQVGGTAPACPCWPFPWPACLAPCEDGLHRHWTLCGVLLGRPGLVACHPAAMRLALMLSARFLLDLQGQEDPYEVLLGRYIEMGFTREEVAMALAVVGPDHGADAERIGACRSVPTGSRL